MKHFHLSTILAMNAARLAAPPRAVCGPVLADGENPRELIEQINRAVEEMRATHEQQINARVPDVLFNEKITAIEASLATLEEGLTLINARTDPLAESGGVIGDIPASTPEYRGAWNSHVRHGEVSAAMSIGSDPDGGYLAPIEWDRSLTRALVTINQLRRYAQVINISAGRGFSRLYASGTPGSGWVGETAARPATSTPTLATMNFAFGEIYANPAITQQALDDPAIDLEAWLNGEVSTEFGRQEGIAFLSGDGVNKPNGLLTYVTGGAAAATHPLGAIVARNTAAVAILTADDVIKLIYDLPEERDGGDTALYVNRAIVLALRLLKDTTGNYLWANPMAATEEATFNGAPVRKLSGMASTVATGNVIALYGDMRAAYLIIDRTGIRVLRDPYTNKPFVHFYTTRRVGGGVQNPEYLKALKVA